MLILPYCQLFLYILKVYPKLNLLKKYEAIFCNYTSL